MRSLRSICREAPALALMENSSLRRGVPSTEIVKALRAAMASLMTTISEKGILMEASLELFL